MDKVKLLEEQVRLLDQNRRVAWAKFYELSRAVLADDLVRARVLAQCADVAADEGISGVVDDGLGAFHHRDLLPGEHIGALAALMDGRRTPPGLVNDRVSAVRRAIRAGRDGA